MTMTRRVVLGAVTALMIVAGTNAQLWNGPKLPQSGRRAEKPSHIGKVIAALFSLTENMFTVRHTA